MKSPKSFLPLAALATCLFAGTVQGYASTPDFRAVSQEALAQSAPVADLGHSAEAAGIKIIVIVTKKTKSDF